MKLGKHQKLGKLYTKDQVLEQIENERKELFREKKRLQEQLKQLREQHRLEKQELYELTGIAISTINRWEDTLTNINLKSLLKLLSVYDVAITFEPQNSYNSNNHYNSDIELQLKYLREQINELLLKQELTLKELSHITETNMCSISRFLNEKGVPRLDTLLKIAQKFNVKIQLKSLHETENTCKQK